MEKRLPYLFISYSHSDSPFALKLAERLRKAGIEHFLDANCVMWGDNIHSRILEHFERVTHLVVLISPGSMKSQWVSYEMGFAHGRNLKLIPYLLHPDMEIPSFLANLRYMKSLNDVKSFIQSLRSIGSAIHSLSDTKTLALPQNEADNYKGWCELNVASDIINDFNDKKYAKIFDSIKEQIQDVPINSFVRMRDVCSNVCALARIDYDRKIIKPVIKTGKEGILGTYPRNFEHVLVLDLLNDDSIRLLSIVGNKYTNKMKFVIATGLKKVLDDSVYQRVIITRPLSAKQTLETSLLPNKIMTWMQSYVDYLELLELSDQGKIQNNRGYLKLVQKGFLEIVPLSAIMGRLIRNAYIIVDNSHSLDIDEFKDIICCADEQSKIIFTSDLSRLNDSSTANRGLSYLINKLKGERYYGHLIMKSKGTDSLSDLFGDGP